MASGFSCSTWKASQDRGSLELVQSQQVQWPLPCQRSRRGRPLEWGTLESPTFTLLGPATGPLLEMLSPMLQVRLFWQEPGEQNMLEKRWTQAAPSVHTGVTWTGPGEPLATGARDHTLGEENGLTWGSLSLFNIIKDHNCNT